MTRIYVRVYSIKKNRASDSNGATNTFLLTLFKEHNYILTE
nr:MAG TPA: hypothetical protein [Caudoviricetes sp.]